MNDLTTKKRLNMFVIGSITTLLFLLMFYALFAQLLTDFVIGVSDDTSILYIIILGLLLITFLSSIIVSFFIMKNVSQKAIIKTSIMSTVLTFFVLLVLSYTSLYILYPAIFRELQDIEVLLVFPQVILYFGIYVFGQVFVMFILVIIIYYIFFVMFLDVFYEYIPKKYVKKQNWKW